MTLAQRIDYFPGMTDRQRIIDRHCLYYGLDVAWMDVAWFDDHLPVNALAALLNDLAPKSDKQIFYGFIQRYVADYVTQLIDRGLLSSATAFMASVRAGYAYEWFGNFPLAEARLAMALNPADASAQTEVNAFQAEMIK